jgi:hypothetical protein
VTTILDLNSERGNGSDLGQYAWFHACTSIPCRCFDGLDATWQFTDPTELPVPGDPIPEGPEEPTTDPITEDDPRVGHEPVEE